MNHTILFLCPHGAAKSVMAAAYFQRLANQRQLDVTATFAGTEPDAAISPAVAELLQAEGMDVTGQLPRHVATEELTKAWRVVSLGCDVTHLALPGLSVEQWDDVPPPSQNLIAARDIILAHVERLADELKSSGASL
jgi:arsenate reductase (thioredoxin)